jgi:hypothetical protein
LLTWQESIKNGVNNTPGPTENWWQLTPSASALQNQAAAQAKLKMFECPSDDLRNQTPTVGVLAGTVWFYDGTSTPNWWVAEPWAGYYPINVTTGFWPALGRTNYAVCGGGSGAALKTATAGDIFARYEGCFKNNSQLTLGQLTVQDGTSNTILLGETTGGSRIPVCDYVLPWIAPGCISTGAGLGRGNLPSEDYMTNGWDPNNRSPRGASWYHFSGMHTAGVQFAMGDGSIRTIRYGNTLPPAANITTATALNLDYMILMQISGKNDGLNQDTSSISE